MNDRKYWFLLLPVNFILLALILLLNRTIFVEKIVGLCKKVFSEEEILQINENDFSNVILRPRFANYGTVPVVCFGHITTFVEKNLGAPSYFSVYRNGVLIREKLNNQAFFLDKKLDLEEFRSVDYLITVTYKKSKEKRLFTSEPNVFIKGKPQFLTLELKKPIEKYLGNRISVYNEPVRNFIKDTALQTLKHLTYVVTDQSINQNSIKDIKLIFDPPNYTVVVYKNDNTSIVQKGLEGPRVHIKFDSTFSDHSFFWDDAVISWYFLKVFPDLSRSTLNFWYKLRVRDGENKGLIPREIRTNNYFLTEGKKEFVGENINPISYVPLNSLQVTNPFFLSKIEIDLYKLYGDKERLKRVLPFFVEYFEWLEKHRKKIDPETNCPYYEFSNLGSGMDNVMRGFGDFNPKLQNFGWVDIAAQQVFLVQDIEWMRKELGLEEKINVSEIKDSFVRCYFDASNGLFWDRSYELGFVKNPHTLASSWILFIDFGEKNDFYKRKTVELLTDPDKFGGDPAIPSVSRSDPLFREEGDYWRGGVWPPMNWLIIKGLELSEYFDIKEILKSKTVKLLFEVYEKEKTVFEYYSPTLTFGKPSPGKQDGVPAKSDFYGWGSIIVGLAD